jgi:hypothetical protein
LAYRGGLPDDYSPAEGLQAAAKAEALERYFARAKDATKLYEAVQIKLGEQRRFVLWWDEQQKRRATPGNLGASQTSDGPAAADFGLNRETISRWRKRLKDPKKFDATLQSSHERCRRVCETDKGATEQKGTSGTGERSTVSLSLPDDLTLDGWVAASKSLETVERSHMWWIGDWLVFGGKYGDKYEAAAKSTGFKYGILANAASVARRFADFSLRSENLGWHHHKASAAIADDRFLARLLALVELEGRVSPD